VDGELWRRVEGVVERLLLGGPMLECAIDSFHE
jgi:hypothetical protein